VNISKYKTTKEEAAVLSKGLNFAVSPEAILTDLYWAGVQISPRGGVPPVSSEISRTASLCQTSAVQPVQGERQALGNLAKNKAITILPADSDYEHI